jgi:hypothetical protein
MVEAEAAPLRNGFSRYETDKTAQGFIAKPEPPFWEGSPLSGNKWVICA